ncbi:MAG TPA: hypothetical protein VGS21_10660 [Acidimicrobiales bacterium]|nr:hypothetical protein [Acidimicrobiales bacterium]
MTDRLVVLLVVALLATVGAACQKSAGGSTTTTAPPVGGSPTTAPSGGGSATTTTGASGAQGGGGAQTLVSPLCNILDGATINRIMGTTVGPCQNFPKEDDSARCLYGDISTEKTVQLTAWAGALLAPELARWGFLPKVSGVGQAAWSTGAINLPNGIVDVSLYVNYGSFALQFAVTGPRVSMATAVALAKAIK